MKTAAREWPRVLVHALDLPCGEPSDAAIAAVVRTAIDGGPIEIGFADRLGTLQLPPARPEGAGVVLGEHDVVVVTGGARGVTAAVALELARRGRPSLVLVGRSPVPGEEPAWAQSLHSEAEIKAALLARATERPSPRELSAQCDALLAAR